MERAGEEGEAPARHAVRVGHPLLGDGQRIARVEEVVEPTLTRPVVPAGARLRGKTGASVGVGVEGRQASLELELALPATEPERHVRAVAEGKPDVARGLLLVVAVHELRRVGDVATAVRRRHERQRDRLEDGALADAVDAEEHEPGLPLRAGAVLRELDRKATDGLEVLEMDLLEPDGPGLGALSLQRLRGDRLLPEVLGDELALHGRVRGRSGNESLLPCQELLLRHRHEQRVQLLRRGTTRPHQVPTVEGEDVDGDLAPLGRARDRAVGRELELDLGLVGARVEEQSLLLRQVAGARARRGPLAAHRKPRALGAVAGGAGGVEVLPGVGEPPVVVGVGAAGETHGVVGRAEPVDVEDGGERRLAVGALALEQLEQCLPQRLVRQDGPLVGRSALAPLAPLEVVERSE